MFENMSKSEFNECAKQNRLIPVWGRKHIEEVDALALFQNLHPFYSRAGIYESDEQGQYCFIGLDLAIHFESTGSKITIETNDKQIDQFEADPITTLRRLFLNHKAVDLPGHPLFMGGAMGYFAYDSIRLTEKIPDRHPNKENLPEILFNFYETMLVVDKMNKVVTVYILVKPETSHQNSHSRAIKEIKHIFDLMTTKNSNEKFIPKSNTSKISVDISDDDYKKIVEKAKYHIHEGDIFQVVLSRTFRKKTEAEAFDIFKALYHVNPSPYMFFFKEPNYQIAGSSPERLVTLKDGILKTNPLAGTLPRPNPEEERIKEEELLNNPKETAEHMMLVDLGRNDIGSIAVVGSVKVTALKSILRLSHVIHISSEIEGVINTHLDGLDAIRATLPAGTLSGAPKIRAMEIIDELENSRRGVYGGAICYIDNKGNLDSCIAIRMVVISDGIASVRTGAGIVYDSIPENEVNETKHKAKGPLRAIECAEKGEL